MGNGITLKTKPEFEEAARRVEAWWEGKLLDRVPAAVTAPRDPTLHPPVPEPGSTAERWWSTDYVLRRAHAEIRATAFKGEAFPVFCPGLGYEFLAGAAGCSLVFGERDVRASSPFRRLSDVPEITLRKANPYLRWVDSCLTEAVKESRGWYLAGVPTLQNPLDCLVSLLSYRTVVKEISENEARIRWILGDITALWKKLYTRFSTRLRDAYGGTPGDPVLFSPGKTYAFLSWRTCTSAHAALFLPLLLEVLGDISRFVDTVLFHLPATAPPAAVESILATPSLTGIHVEVTHYRLWRERVKGILEKAQEAGKRIHVAVPPADVRPLLDDVSSHGGLMLRVHARNEAEADEVLRAAAGVGE